VVTGAAIGVLFVLAFVWTQLLSSATRHLVPLAVRSTCQAVFAACGVTLLGMYMQAYFLDLQQALGVYLPVLAGCCLIVARAEEFAARQPLWPTMCDGLAHAGGAMVFVLLMSVVREGLAYGTLLRDAELLGPASAGLRPVEVLPAGWSLPIAAMPAGALLVLGGLLAVHRVLTNAGAADHDRSR
jgi:electron transport complex protein RnfE